MKPRPKGAKINLRMPQSTLDRIDGLVSALAGADGSVDFPEGICRSSILRQAIARGIQALEGKWMPKPKP